MDFVELREETLEHCRLWGFDKTSPPPDTSRLVNRAYREMVWEAESRRSTLTLSTVADQAEYTLTSPDWKTILDVLHDGTPVYPINESNLRMEDREWLDRDSATPRYYWIINNNILRFYPTPDTADLVITVYGTRAPAELSSDTDEPAIPVAYHEGIPLGAAYKHIRKYAKAQSRDAMKDMYDEYQSYITKLKSDFSARTIWRGYRYTSDLEADRVDF